VAHGHARSLPETRGCDLWEPVFDCLDCAACCGPAYDTVEVAPRDPVILLHPELIEKRDGRQQVMRAPGNWCAALLPDRRCRIYENRPLCCRGFTKGSDNCLIARRRLGLSPR